MGSLALELQLGYFSLGTSALGFVACEFSFEIFRLGIFVWVFVAISWVQTQTKLRHHLLDVGTIRLGIFTWELSLGNSSLETSVW